MGKATEQQPEPAGKGKPITDLLIHDLIERQELGTRKYGEPLKAFNGRDPLLDAYQELIDLLVYLRQYMEESKTNEIVILRRMLELAADNAWFWQISEPGFIAKTLAPSGQFATIDEWKEQWLAGLWSQAIAE